ncbi:MAG TPA: glycosyltransferase family 4 protein [Thermoanaerobaculia bacterium]|nr:glycosyltransferase family 4 protein [Thermoanaerobaculia bacterium]
MTIEPTAIERRSIEHGSDTLPLRAPPLSLLFLMHTAVFSIISPNYRHAARVLMASVERHHPEWERFVLFVGDASTGDHDDEMFTSVRLEALRLPHPRQFCFRYSILELNTAVKPWMLEHLFERGYDRVIYIDPDIVLYSPLVEIEQAPSETFLTLTPHLTGSIEGDEHPCERTILQAGTYNLGFLAVTRQPQLSRFLKWWQEKLEFECVVDPVRGLFVDQKWIDLTPGLFPEVRILRHDGYNVAYWNLGQRKVSREGDSYAVNGQTLRFFHFSGYDPASPDTVSKHSYYTQKVRDFGDASKLFHDYDIALRTAGYESFRNAPYAYGVFADGTRLPDVAREAYRNSSALQSSCGDDPFQHPEVFRGLRDRPRSPRAARVAVRAYRTLSRARPLVLLFPRKLRTAMREFLLGRRETTPPMASRAATSLPPGLNIVGNAMHDTGVGESARLCQKACEASGLSSHLIDVGNPDGLAQQPVYRTSIYHVNADQLPAVYNDMPDLFSASSYNIGCWHWELPELPDELASSAEPLDEIWAPSAFIQRAISPKVTIPVVHMPHGIEVTSMEACSPEELGVPRGRFPFLCMFDFDSVMHRKNPLGAAEAFRRAFPHEGSPALLIKAGHAAGHPKEYAELKEQLRGIPNVYLTDRMLSRARVNGLLAACDGIVSLHRSEGFGLILAEAMYLGKPVIATGWSGNMDFMDTRNSCPVGYEIVTLDRAYGSYPAGQHWAEPDIDHAAHFLRRVFEDTDYRRQLGERARDTIRSQFSPEAAGLRYRQRLAFLGLMNAAGSNAGAMP